MNDILSALVIFITLFVVGLNVRFWLRYRWPRVGLRRGSPWLMDNFGLTINFDELEAEE